jgi:hypothetical protein
LNDVDDGDVKTLAVELGGVGAGAGHCHHRRGVDRRGAV